MIKRIALLGTGIVGGSLGMTWKARMPGLTIAGCDEPEVLEEAAHRGAIDERAATPHAAVRDADLVVLATPMPAALHLLETIAPHLPMKAVVTDVGALKSPIMAQADELIDKGPTFIGGHPLVETAGTGIHRAGIGLFDDRPYVLCLPADVTVDVLVERYSGVHALIQSTGGRLLILEAARHDRILAAARHLPQLLSALLTRQIGTLSDETKEAYRLVEACRTPRSTRASTARASREELVGNEGFLLDAMSRFATDLQKTRNRLAAEDLDALESLLAGTASDGSPPLF